MNDVFKLNMRENFCPVIKKNVLINMESSKKDHPCLNYNECEKKSGGCKNKYVQKII